MWLVIFTLGAAVIVVIVTGGKFSELARMRFSSVWALGVGIGLQVLLEVVEIPKDNSTRSGTGS